jgi:hypothetical protein
MRIKRPRAMKARWASPGERPSGSRQDPPTAGKIPRGGLGVDANSFGACSVRPPVFRRRSCLKPIWSDAAAPLARLAGGSGEIAGVVPAPAERSEMMIPRASRSERQRNTGAAAFAILDVRRARVEIHDPLHER